MVDIRILEGTRDLRNFPYEKIGYRVPTQITYKLYYVKWPPCHSPTLPYQGQKYVFLLY